MDTESWIRGVLFVHLLLMLMVGRRHLSKTQSSETRKKVARLTALYWIISLVIVVVSMLVTALVAAGLLARQLVGNTYIVWIIQAIVALVVALISAWLSDKKLRTVV